MATRTRASVKDTTDALVNMKPEDAQRVLSSVIEGPHRCISSAYQSLTVGGPQVAWEGADGVRYQMYHWRAYMYLTVGRIPALYTSRRQCSNRRCVNPAHRS